MSQSTSDGILRFIDGHDVQDYLHGRPLRTGDRIIVECNGFSHHACYSDAGPKSQPLFCINDACFPLDDLTAVRWP